jgi:hypothetical protein
MTPSGMELATFRLVAQCLNQLLHQQRAPKRFMLLGSNAVTLAPVITNTMSE